MVIFPPVIAPVVAGEMVKELDEPIAAMTELAAILVPVTPMPTEILVSVGRTALTAVPADAAVQVAVTAALKQCPPCKSSTLNESHMPEVAKIKIP